MAKGKWFKEGAECWVYSTIAKEIRHGRIVFIGHRWTYVETDDGFGTCPYLTDEEVFYSEYTLKKHYGMI